MLLALLLGVATLLAACGGQAASSSPSATAALKGQSVSVLYAGSLVNLMEHGIGMGFEQSSGAVYGGQGAGSVALANGIKDKTKSGDVFISADPAVNASLIGPANGNWADWWVVFARTSMVIGYSPKSRFAADLDKAKAGTMPWYQVLQEPGFKLGRTDPVLDPKGYRTFFMFQLAQDFYKVPDLRQKVLGADSNADQVFPEETLETRLESGALDAGVFYLNEAAEKGLPYISLPDEINLSNPAMASNYDKASWTSPKGQTSIGGPIVYTATVLNQAKNPAAAEAFVNYLLSSGGQSIMKDHGLLAADVLYGGDKAKIPASLQSKVKGPYQA